MSGCHKASNHSLIDGTYDPLCLKRYYFENEVVDNVHISDRILQHLLLKQLKPTFKHIMNSMDIHYIRFQDDFLALCKSKRQLNRCRKRMMDVLSERQLQLSRQKSCMGTITDSFDFLGIHYSLTQPENHISVTCANDDAIATNQTARSLGNRG